MTAQPLVTTRLVLGGASPNILIALVVGLVLHLRGSAPIVAAWCVGLGADALTIERLGFHSFSYACVAGLLVWLRPMLHVNGLFTFPALTLASALLLETVWLIYRRWWYAIPDSLVSSFLRDVLWSAMYTSGCSAVLYWTVRFLATLMRHRMSRTLREVPNRV